MPIGYLLLICALILVIFGLTDGLLHRLKIPVYFAVIVLLSMLFGAIFGEIVVSSTVTINIGGVIPVIIGIILLFLMPMTHKLAGLFLCVLCGSIILLIMQYAYQPDDPGLLFGIICASAASFGARQMRISLFTACTAPIISELFGNVYDLISGGHSIYNLGAGIWLDTTVVSLLLTLGILFVMESFRRKRIRNSTRL